MGRSLLYLFAIIILNLISANLQAQTDLVSNVNFTVDSVQVKITYELNGDITKEYEVSATMHNKTDGSVYSLTSVKGNVGKGKFAGSYNTIYWEYGKDYEIIPNTTDFEFNVTAKEVPTSSTNNTRSNTKKDSGGSTWYYYVGGAVVAIVVLALTVFNKSNKDSGGDEIPAPPARP